MSGGDEYSFEYTEGSYSEADIDSENQYFRSKLIKDEPNKALQSFLKVLEIEGTGKSEWAFKALKQIIKLLFNLGKYEELIKKYQLFLTYDCVNPNRREKSISTIFDLVSSSHDTDFLVKFYELTLESLKVTKYDQLWFKTNTMLGKIYHENAEYDKLSVVIKHLRQDCFEDAQDIKKGSQLLEILAIEMQMYESQNNYAKLKTLYEQTLNIKSSVPHPYVAGVISECAGKMHLSEGHYAKAHNDFLEAFRNYERCGNHKKIACLKYLVFLNMFKKSDKFLYMKEFRMYRNELEIVAMDELVNAYHSGVLLEYEVVLRMNKLSLTQDSFIKEHLGILTNKLRTQVFLRLIKAYRRIRIPFIARQFNIDVDEVENVLASCIRENKIKGKIDQLNQVLVIED